jgi:exonuclease SbcD
MRQKGGFSMKLIHTSDWHFGMNLGTGSYAEDQRHFLKELYELIRREGIQALLLSGDIYDSSVVSAEAIGLYNEAMTKLCLELGLTVISIAGNHDSAARLASCRELLKGAGLHITGKPERDPVPVLLDGGNVAVYSIPFFTRDEIIALLPEKKDEIRNTETAMLAYCNHIRERMDGNRKNIVLSHSLIVGSELSESDRSARVGFATAVSKDVFQGFDYVALGHIHKPQAIEKHIRYSGSPLKYSFGAEESQEKGVVVIDTDTMDIRFVPISPLRERRSATGTFDEILAREDIREDYLRLYVTDKYAGLELIGQLRERFPYLLEVYGKSLSEEGELSALTVEELEEMNEEDIMIKFLAENFSAEPTPEQLQLFRDVLEWSREEGTLG